MKALCDRYIDWHDHLDLLCLRLEETDIPANVMRKLEGAALISIEEFCSTYLEYLDAVYKTEFMHFAVSFSGSMSIENGRFCGSGEFFHNPIPFIEVDTR